MYCSSASALQSPSGVPLSPKTQPVKIPQGESGNYVTLGVMKRLVTKGSRQFTVRQKAIAITQGIAYDDPQGLAAAIKAYLARIPFTMDPFNDQSLYSPEVSIELADQGQLQIACASIAVLGAALARSIGMRTGFMLLAFEGGPQIFSHIFAVVSDGDMPGAEWYDLDSTALSQRGVRAAPAARSKFVPIG
jgi:hypothetical protein